MAQLGNRKTNAETQSLAFFKVIASKFKYSMKFSTTSPKSSVPVGSHPKVAQNDSSKLIAARYRTFVGGFSKRFLNDSFDLRFSKLFLDFTLFQFGTLFPRFLSPHLLGTSAELSSECA